MPRKQTITFADLRVGVVIAIAAVVFMATTVYITREGGVSLFGGQYTVYSYLRDVNGLKAGAPVHLSGVDVGSVGRVEFADGTAPAPVRVTMNLRTEIRDRVTTNSLITIGSLGVLGEKLLDIDPGPPGGTPIEDGGTVPGEAEGDPIKGIISDASRTMRDIRDLAREIQEGKGTLGAILKREDLHTQVMSFLEKSQVVIDRLNASEGTMGKLLRDPEFYNNMNELTLSMKGLVSDINSGDGALGRLVRDEQIGDSIEKMTGNLASVTGRMDQGEGTIGAFMRERELYDRINSLSGNIDSISARLSRGDGTAGQLLHDRELYDNLNRTFTELQGLISDIREDPRKYLRVKVSLF